MNDLTKIAQKAGLSPTFINWFSDYPEAALGELWKWWQMKEQVVECLETTGSDIEHNENCDENCEGCSKIDSYDLLRNIRNQNFIKEKLF